MLISYTLPLLLPGPVISFTDIVVMCLFYLYFATLINYDKVSHSVWAFKFKLLLQLRMMPVALPYLQHDMLLLNSYMFESPGKY